jgi:hypothetical protein
MEKVTQVLEAIKHSAMIDVQIPMYAYTLIVFLFGMMFGSLV